jgi:hypothetical protein
MSIQIEILKDSYYKPEEVAGNLAKIAAIRSQFGSIINAACSSSAGNLPEYLLTGLIFIESAGNPNSKNGSTYGLAQIDTKTASNIPQWLKKKAGIMTPVQEAKIYEFFGKKRGDCLLNMSWDNAPTACSGGFDSTNIITKEDLYKPEIGIWLCSMLLDYLIWKYSSVAIVGSPTKVRFDKAIVYYNGGQGKAAKLPFYLNAADTTNWVGTNLSSTTKDYILKFIGSNGVVDSLTRK